MKLGFYVFSGMANTMAALVFRFRLALKLWLANLVRLSLKNLICLKLSDWDETLCLGVFEHGKHDGGIGFLIQVNAEALAGKPG